MKAPDRNPAFPSFLYNPLELVVNGPPGSGKTTLITRLIEHFSPKRRLGYVKHAKHVFDLDREGKDTWRAGQAGAERILIEGPSNRALISRDDARPDETRTLMLAKDAVFIESYKIPDAPRIVVLDRDAESRRRVFDGDYTRVVACAGPEPDLPEGRGRIPYYHRDDIPGLAGAIERQWARSIGLRPLHGLVLTGGHSTRMGVDKASLRYGDATLCERACELVSPHCATCHVSCRADQERTPSRSGRPCIPDRFLEIGPLGGILSAMQAHPEAAWLVLACDMPHVDSETLRHLLQRRNPFKSATAFCPPASDTPEPLCTIYEPKSVFFLLARLAHGDYSPKNALRTMEIERIPLEDDAPLTNINTPGDWNSARPSGG